MDAAMQRSTLILLATGALQLLSLVAVPAGRAAAETGRFGVEAAALCAAHVSAAEQAEGLPSGLLTALSLVEAGRWDPARAATAAWPWTVTAGGVGKFYRTKAEAATAVRTHLERGIRNVDVGCMQVNLGYHGDAFATVEDALDPGTNVAYAVSFLTRLHDETRSWTRAVGRYHSSNSIHSNPYTAKFLRAWRQVRRDAALAQRAAAGAAGARSTAESATAAGPESSRPATEPTEASDIKERRTRFAEWLAERLRRPVSGGKVERASEPS